jgi:hypothetical protein
LLSFSNKQARALCRQFLAALLLGVLAAALGCSGGMPPADGQALPDDMLQDQLPSPADFPPEFVADVAKLPATLEPSAIAAVTPTPLPVSCSGARPFDGTSGWIEVWQADVSNPHNLVLQSETRESASAAWAVYGFAVIASTDLELSLAATQFGPAGIGIAVRYSDGNGQHSWQPAAYSMTPDPVVKLRHSGAALASADGVLQVAVLCPAAAIVSVTDITLSVATT